MPKATPWRETFKVRSYESTPDATVSVQSICNYLQEAAGNSARELGFSIEQMTEEHLTWVMGRLHVQLDRHPVWREDIEVETWPSGHNGLAATRDFMLRASGQEFGRGTSAWYTVDIRRKRPVRLPEFVQEVEPPYAEPALPHDFPRMQMPDEFPHAAEFNVRYSDLDMNRHVNNVRYVEWAMESVPRSEIAGLALREIDIQFKAETVEGERIRAAASLTSTSEGLEVMHRLTVVGDGREVALAKSEWRPQ